MIFLGYLYDGVHTLFTTSRLPDQLTEFKCETREGKAYKLIVKFTKQIFDRNDNRVLRVMNIMLRRAMECLNLKLIQRNLFDTDPNAEVISYLISFSNIKSHVLFFRSISRNLSLIYGQVMKHPFVNMRKTFFSIVTCDLK